MMGKLIETGFFAMLAESSRENFSQEEYRNAVREFVDELLTLCRMETDFASLYRELEFTRIWLECWMDQASEDGEAGKKWSQVLCDGRVEMCTDGMGIIVHTNGSP